MKVGRIERWMEYWLGHSYIYIYIYIYIFIYIYIYREREREGRGRDGKERKAGIFIGKQEEQFLTNWRN